MYNSDPPSNTQLNAWQHWAFRVEQRLQEQQDLIHQLQQELEQLKQQTSREQQTAPTIHVDKIEYHFDQLKVDTLEGSLQIGLSTSNPEQLPLMIEDIMMKQQQENGTANAPMSNGSNGFSNGASSYPEAQSPFLGKYSSKPNSKLTEIQHNFQNMREKKDNKAEPAANDSMKQHQPNLAEAQGQTGRSELAIQYMMDCCLDMLHNELTSSFTQYIERQSSLMNVEMNDEHRKLIIDDIARQLPARVHHYIMDQQAKHRDVSTDQLVQQVITLTRGDIEGAIDQYIYQLIQK